MSLRDKAVLEIDLEGETGVFELEIGLDQTEEIQKSFVMSERGQYLSEIYDQLDGIGDDLFGDDDGDPGVGGRRMGYHVDGGAGSHSWTLTFESGQYDGRWGDGSSDGDDPDDVTMFDAAGAHPVPAMQVLSYYIAQARTDSSGQARLHIGEWTDGEYSDEAGVFEEPLDVAILSSSFSRGEDDTSSFEGTLELIRAAKFPDVGGAVADAIDWITDR